MSNNNRNLGNNWEKFDQLAPNLLLKGKQISRYINNQDKTIYISWLKVTLKVNLKINPKQDNHVVTRFSSLTARKWIYILHFECSVINNVH